MMKKKRGGRVLEEREFHWEGKQKKNNRVKKS